jgi:hypothetical protein
MSPFKSHLILQDAFNVTSHASTYHKWKMYEGFHNLAIKDFNWGEGGGGVRKRRDKMIQLQKATINWCMVGIL